MSEIYSQLGNRHECLQHLIEFRRLAQKCASRSQEQLSFHVEAWCINQLYATGDANLTDVDSAIEATRKSREMVEKWGKAFKESEPGGSVKQRKAQLYILEAQLEELHGHNQKAMQLLDKADRLLSANDKTIRYELRRTRCAVAPVDRRIDLAELMEDEAPEDKKAMAMCELAHHYVAAQHIDKGYRKLVMAYMTQREHLNPPEKEEMTRRLAILYRLVRYEKILKNQSQEPRITLCELYEAVGDLYDKYWQTMTEREKRDYREFVVKKILENYKKMLEHKRDNDDALRAYLAMALVYGDLDDHQQSMQFFQKRLDLLTKSGASRDKIIDTRVSLFTCMCKLSDPKVESTFSELDTLCFMDSNRKELYESFSAYCAERNEPENAEKWRKEAKKIRDSLVKNEDDETDVLFGKLSDRDVLKLCRKEHELINLDNLTKYQLEKTNDMGETRLHQAAKEDNAEVVRKLCQLGCDVNARDNGGWTPLSEAVAHDEYKNVEVLLAYGADVNSRSKESFVSEDSCESQEKGNHFRLTPLMEACTNGFVRIAQLLIERSAKIELRDSAGWTALDHLRHGIAEKGASREVQRFEDYLVMKMKEYDLPPLKIPISAVFKTTRSGGRSELDDSPPDDEEECLILDGLASRKRRNSPSFEQNVSKRRARSGENLRPPSASPSPRPPRIPKVPVIRRSPVGSQSPPPHHQFFQRNATVRRSNSPTMTVRSDPTVYGKDDDVEVIGCVKRRSRQSFSPPKTSSTRQPLPTNSVVVVKCHFELPEGSHERIQSIMLPIERTLTIGETKRRVLSQIRQPQLKVASVWRHGDVDKCLLADELLLAHLSSVNDLALVFRMAAPPADQVYQEITESE
ncbi:unnamed protein product [Caenorhabditis sp. 36 PRJEB53466]|nr:unnamed protein product [Caenorhabditis sp. 36 PRJEB53466]